MATLQRFNLYGFTLFIAKPRCTFLAFKANTKNLSLMCFDAFESHGCLTSPYGLMFCTYHNNKKDMACILNIFWSFKIIGKCLSTFMGNNLFPSSLYQGALHFGQVQHLYTLFEIGHVPFPTSIYFL